MSNVVVSAKTVVVSMALQELVVSVVNVASMVLNVAIVVVLNDA